MLGNQTGVHNIVSFYELTRLCHVSPCFLGTCLAVSDIRIHIDNLYH